MLKMAAPLDFFDASRRAEAPSSGILGTRLHFFFIITQPAAMRKENQEKFSKNLWALYAPDVTAAQGLPAAPSGRRQAARRARGLRRDRAPGQAGRPPRLPAKACRPRRVLAGRGASGRLGGRRKRPPARQTASARTEPASAPAKTRPVRRGGCRPDSPSAQAAPAPAPARRLP